MVPPRQLINRFPLVFFYSVRNVHEWSTLKLMLHIVGWQTFSLVIMILIKNKQTTNHSIGNQCSHFATHVRPTHHAACTAKRRPLNRSNSCLYLVVFLRIKRTPTFTNQLECFHKPLLFVHIQCVPNQNTVSRGCYGDTSTTNSNPRRSPSRCSSMQFLHRTPSLPSTLTRKDYSVLHS